MKIYYSETVIEYYLDELKNNKVVGLVSDRQTGKSILSIQLTIEQMLRYNKNAIVLHNFYRTEPHIIDKIIFVLTQYGMSYIVKNNYIEFNGLKIKVDVYKNLMIRLAPQYSDIIICIDELYYCDEHKLNYMNYLKHKYNSILFNDLKENFKYTDAKIIDNTTITEIYLRKLKINRLLNEQIDNTCIIL